jgi:phosphatidylserine/phosphatidylglycerophosphate/cardiolipin synthase-like enzyme
VSGVLNAPCCGATSPSPSATTTPPAATVCFTPGGNCTDAMIHALNDATRTVLVQAYRFTSAPIATAVLDAYKRGMEVILDKSQRTETYASADCLANQGVPTMIDVNHAIAHHQVIVIDGEVVITGRVHFTKGDQERNAEQVLIIRDQALAAQDTQNWQVHAPHCQPDVGRGARP